MFNLTLHIKHTVNEAGMEHFDIDQRLSGGIPAARETRLLDWQEREEHDDIFGHLFDKTRRIPVEEVVDEFLKTGWTQDTIDNDIVLADSWSAPTNKYTWRAIQVVALLLLAVLFSPHIPDMGLRDGEWGKAICQTHYLHLI